jgi:hypothetical protein
MSKFAPFQPLNRQKITHAHHGQLIRSFDTLDPWQFILPLITSAALPPHIYLINSHHLPELQSTYLEQILLAISFRAG